MAQLTLLWVLGCGPAPDGTLPSPGGADSAAPAAMAMPI